MENFFKRYFEGKSWQPRCQKILEAALSEYEEGIKQWTNLPASSSECEFWRWLSDFQTKYFDDAPSKYCKTTKKEEMLNTSGDAQLDIFTTRPQHAGKPPYDWGHVRVLGEHTSGADNKFWQMSANARHVFIEQPRRPHLHGFTVRWGHTMELYMFDRSGVYCAKPFNIHLEPRKFIYALVGYCLMGDKELGLDDCVEVKGARHIIEMPIEEQKKSIRLEIEEKPIATSRAVVGRGTSCYLSIDGDVAIKFSWPSTARSPNEIAFLQQATKIGVKSVPTLVAHKVFGKVSDHRSDLTFLKRRQNDDRNRMFNKNNSHQESPSISTRRSGSTSGKRRSIPEPDSPSKRPRSNSKISGSSRRPEVGSSEAELDSDIPQSQCETSFVDRVLTCIAIKPAGRLISTFRDATELVVVMRDAIQASKNLFLQGKILHRDISSNNIIIVDSAIGCGYKGYLIDFDMATMVDENPQNVRTGSERITGTLKFMAIEILETAYRDGKSSLVHTYRHDLESFLYVFLSICVDRGRNHSHVDPFSGWYLNSYEDMAYIKFSHMSSQHFDRAVLSKFPRRLESLKAPAKAMRDALFLVGGDLRKETPQGDASILYDKVINVFNDALKSLPRNGVST